MGQSLASSGHRCLEGGMGIVLHSARSYGYLECQNEIVEWIQSFEMAWDNARLTDIIAFTLSSRECMSQIAHFYGKIFA